MDVALTTRIDENAKVLTEGAEDRAVLPVQVEVQNNDEGELILALENFRFELHDQSDALLEVLTARPRSGHVGELSQGEHGRVSTTLVVHDAHVEPNQPYRLATHAFGQTESVEFRFL
jgi:hypothetical protein